MPGSVLECQRVPKSTKECKGELISAIECKVVSLGVQGSALECQGVKAFYSLLRNRLCWTLISSAHISLKQCKFVFSVLYISKNL